MNRERTASTSSTSLRSGRKVTNLLLEEYFHRVPLQATDSRISVSPTDPALTGYCSGSLFSLDPACERVHAPHKLHRHPRRTFESPKTLLVLVRPQCGDERPRPLSKPTLNIAHGSDPLEVYREYPFLRSTMRGRERARRERRGTDGCVVWCANDRYLQLDCGRVPGPGEAFDSEWFVGSSTFSGFRHKKTAVGRSYETVSTAKEIAPPSRSLAVSGRECMENNDSKKSNSVRSGDSRTVFTRLLSNSGLMCTILRSRTKPQTTIMKVEIVIIENHEPCRSAGSKLLARIHLDFSVLLPLECTLFSTLPIYPYEAATNVFIKSPTVATITLLLNKARRAVNAHATWEVSKSTKTEHQRNIFRLQGLYAAHPIIYIPDQLSQIRQRPLANVHTIPYDIDHVTLHFTHTVDTCP
ncbi:hypothetical protein BC629DRAFT_1437289 [Irpex lacteus]|nr:hypothetical protein BC629DRAFT_1437289 [Irpex lacteus]